MTLSAPARIWHYALFTPFATGSPGDEAVDALRMLYRRHGLEFPEQPGSHLQGRFPDFTLRYERHAEFLTITVIREGPVLAPFGGDLGHDAVVPWLEALPGERLVAVKVVVWSGDDPEPDASALASLLDSRSLCGARLKQGGTTVWTDFRIHTDGHERIAFRNLGQDRHQLGRLVQRTLELFNYRALALLALPPAREYGPRLRDMGVRLATFIARMRDETDLDADRGLLDELVRLSAEIEDIGAVTAYRYSAARAYQSLVDARLASLEEQRIGQLQTLSVFLTRRLAPALDTVESIADRQNRLSERIMRASNLLRTRVDCAMEAQNRDLLKSMERRAHLQLRLQQTVEGLSVAAITYYVVGLVGYVAKGANTLGANVPAELAQGLAVPVVVAIVWSGLRRYRRRLGDDEHA